MSPRRRVKNSVLNRKKKITSFFSGVDKKLILIIAFLVFFGLMAVFSAGAPEGIKVADDYLFYFKRQLGAFIAGLFPLIFFANFNYKNLKGLTPLIMLFVLMLVGATIAGLGESASGASRWLSIGPIQIQPSELAKPAVIIAMALALSESKSFFDKKILLTIAWLGILFYFIFLQPNLSMIIILLFTSMAMAMVGGISPQLIFSTIAMAVPFIVFAIASKAYRSNRITGWLDPWQDPQGVGYNVIQSWYAIATGGFWGLGLGSSKQKMFWLPEGHTDFIFAIIAEEHGFIGASFLIFLFLAFIYRGFLIAKKCPDKFGQLLAFGITFSIGFQAFINIAVATGVFPVTGVTLPMISYGGTSIFVTMAMFGILLNISRLKIKRLPIDER